MGVKELVAVEGWPDTHASMLYKDNIADHTATEAGAAPRRRRGAGRAHDVAGVRLHQLDAHVHPRRHAQPVEPGAHTRRFVGWLGGRGRGRHDADLHRQRRRRVDPHPVGLQRAVRLQGQLRPGRRRRQLRRRPHVGSRARSAARCATRRATSTRSPARPTSIPPRCRSRRARTRRRWCRAPRSKRLRGLRAAWSSTLGFAVCDPEVEKRAHEAALALGRRRGHRAGRRRLPLPEAGSGVEHPVEHRRVREPPRGVPRAATKTVTPVSQAGFESIERLTSDQLMRAQQRRWELLRAIADVFDEVDLILTPTTATTAFKAEGPPPMEIAGQPRRRHGHRSRTPRRSTCRACPR